MDIAFILISIFKFSCALLPSNSCLKEGKKKGWWEDRCWTEFKNIVEKNMDYLWGFFYFFLGQQIKQEMKLDQAAVWKNVE